MNPVDFSALLARRRELLNRPELIEARATGTIVHLDRVAPSDARFLERSEGRARCNRNLHARRVLLAPPTALERVTCLTCLETVPIDELELDVGIDRYVINVIASAVARSAPFAARQRATDEIIRRHAAEYAELLETERAFSALEGLR